MSEPVELTPSQNWNSVDFFLYTNIPHNLLLSQMQCILDEAFEIKSGKAYIKVNKSSAHWSEKKVDKSKAWYVSKQDIFDWFM